MRIIIISIFTIILTTILFIPVLSFAESYLPENLVCKFGFVKIFKLSNDNPACVTKNTSEILVERGWGYFDTRLAELFANKTVFNIDEPIHITLKIVGNTTLSDNTSPCGFSVFNEQSELIHRFGGMLQAVCDLHAGDETSWIWGYNPENYQNHNFKPNPPDKYRLQANYHDDLHQYHQFIFDIEIKDPKNVYNSWLIESDWQDIEKMKKAHKVFSGKILEKTLIIEEYNVYDHTVQIENNLKFTSEDTLQFLSHDAYQGCKDLKEGVEYIIFLQKDGLCEYSIELPYERFEELMEFSSLMFWW